MRIEVDHYTNPEMLRLLSKFCADAADIVERERKTDWLGEVTPMPPAPVEEPAPEEKPTKPGKRAKVTPSDPPKVDITTVRALLKAKADAGKREEVKQLMASYGVKSLTEIPEDNLADVLAKAEAL